MASAFLSLTHDGVLVLDRHNRVLSANGPFFQWTSYPRDQVIGRDMVAFWEDGRRWEDWMAGFRLQGGASAHEVLDLRTVTGDPVPVEARLSRITAWGRPGATVLVVHDLRPVRLLEKLVREDPLTGVSSRSAIMERFEAELVRADRLGTSLGVILMDVDGFQGLNDRWGPAFGDQVLRVVGAELRDGIRTSDAAGRMGSDEFLVLLPQASIALAEETAQRLRAGLEARLFAPQNQEVVVTASLGAAVVRPSGIETVTSVLARVDEALDRARTRGRNRVELSP